MKRTLPFALFLSTVAACFATRAPSPYLRITTPSGRVYYANSERTLHSETGGFLSFRDLVTRESVRLKNGEYTALECPVSEIEIRQREYLDDPTKVPQMEPQ